MLGSNSADTAGDRIRATTKEQLFARFGKWSAQAKVAYDPDGSTDLATLVPRANDDFGQAEPARFAIGKGLAGDGAGAVGPRDGRAVETDSLVETTAGPIGAHLPPQWQGDIEQPAP